MGNSRLFAHPWWVNLLILVPLLAYFLFRRWKPQLTKRQRLISALFALSFGFVEGAVVIYLRAAVGLLPGYAGTLSDVARLSADLYRQAQPFSSLPLPPSLLTVEELREATTMLMLLAVPILSTQKQAEGSAIFLWIFALWDLGYYAAPWSTVRWPYSLISPTCSSSFRCRGPRRFGFRS